MPGRSFTVYQPITAAVFPPRQGIGSVSMYKNNTFSCSRFSFPPALAAGGISPLGGSLCKAQIKSGTIRRSFQVLPPCRFAALRGHWGFPCLKPWIRSWAFFPPCSLPALSALPVKTKQNAPSAPLVSNPPQFRRLRLSSTSAPAVSGGTVGGPMVCYSVLVRFTFHQHRAALVATHIKKHHNARPFLVRHGLPFGSGLKYRRFFATKKEAARYVSYLYAVYKGRIIPNPPLPGGQLAWF